MRETVRMHSALGKDIALAPVVFDVKRHGFEHSRRDLSEQPVVHPSRGHGLEAHPLTHRLRGMTALPQQFPDTPLEGSKTWAQQTGLHGFE